MVTFDAPIDKITVEKFRQDTTGIPSGTTVLLNSTSGDLNSGVQLGLYIRNQRFNTSIGRAPGLKTSSQAVDGECFSACLLAFAGGVNRQIDPNDRLGFDALRARSKADTPAQFKEAVRSLGKYLDQMGVDRRLIDLMLETKGTTVQPLEWNRAKQLNLINTNVTTTFPWRIQALENGLLVVLATEKQVSGRYIISLGLTRQNNDYRLTIFVKPSSNGQNLGGLIDFLNSNGNLKLVAGKQVIKPTSIKPWQATTTGMQTIASLTEQDLLQLSSALEFELYLQDLGTNTYGLDNVTIFGTSGLKGAMKTLKK